MIFFSRMLLTFMFSMQILGLGVGFAKGNLVKVFNRFMIAIAMICMVMIGVFILVKGD